MNDFWSKRDRFLVFGTIMTLARLAGAVHAQEGPATRSEKAATGTISFSRDIRPILSNHCFKCHGPDAGERQAEMRLDLREAALGTTASGSIPIVPGKPEVSELVRRIESPDDDVRMPPPDSPKQLSAAQKQMLRDWIAQGALWQEHWSLVTRERPILPQVVRTDWPLGAIDRFVLARLETEGLRPAPEADKRALIRRLTLDLTGLPPTSADVDAFLADSSPDAYERLVDRLLASPRYGERMALEWLDASRFADTHGYHIDSGRDMTRWREWVIDAYNANKPFDQFTVEQLAGDLLPGATVDQRIASGFHRNHMINFEGGAIPEEYHAAYIVDRVNTTGTVWLGLTIGCAQCHDHKYDPITQQEYYQLFAFFHNVPEKGLDGSSGNAAPLLRMPSVEQQQTLDRISASIKELEQRLGAQGAADAQPLKDELDELRKSYAEAEKNVPSVMVMEEMAQARETYLLVRGQYDKRGEKVLPGVPASLPPLPPDAPANRLGLARWLVNGAQPLTARVMVNRFWQTYFGTGIVKTAEDLGSQGELPSHPDLLDWLAAEFVASGWDVKHMQRLIVTSATYRQASIVTPELLARDADNRLLARGARVRLSAEAIRDGALAVSGLLNSQIGGPSVSPYQPPGLWEELASRADGTNWTAQVYTQSHGKDLYRRTMYTFWKRTSPPPTLSTFDAPDRETCTVRRARTNTPLQALILWNDPTYIEAARKLAERMMIEAPPADEERIAFAFRLATARRPSGEELAVLARVFQEQLAAYRQDCDAAQILLGVGESPRNQSLDAAELAAWTMVASVILNLDETVTKS